MKSEIPLEQLLQWRLAHAEAEAPAAPRAARLLDLARPWWEKWPERFQKLAERLGRLEIAYGHAMADSPHVHEAHAVPVVVVGAREETETSARVLYLSTRDGQLRLRFQLETLPGAAEAYEATLVCRATSRPLLVVSAERSFDAEYSLSVELPEELAQAWERLKVTDEMPFRLILRTLESKG